ncbi:MAG: hypothetical protein QG626_805 [Patescibacteria group bacterium]|nr:hypothetical protein [Patescibacteria group bacterium]
MPESEMHHTENYTKPKRSERQIISETGIPVEITSNFDSKKHAEKITLGIGGLELLSEGNERTIAEVQTIVEQRHVLHHKVMSAVIDRLRESDPAFPNDFIPDSPSSGRSIDHRYYEVERQYLEEHPELVEKQKMLDRQTKDAYQKFYSFSDSTKDDIYVGKEGTLIYSEAVGGNIAQELLSARDRARTYEEKKLENWRARIDWKAVKEQLEDADLEVFVEKLRHAKKVIDIHQIEVLRQHQGKGLAKALFDVALWDIEQAKHADTSIARILDNNPDKDKILSLFEKNGYKKLYCPGSEGGMTGGIPNYYLVIKESERRK